jgi:hypothetical protein
MTDAFLGILELAFGVPLFAWWPLSATLACFLVYSFVRQRPLRVLSVPHFLLYILAPFTLCLIQVVLGYSFAAPHFWARGSRIGTGLVALVFLLSILGGVLMIRWLPTVRLFATALVLMQLLFATSSALTALVLIHSIDLTA